MARYWVGGSGTWDASTTTHWSTSSGGAGGASVPTASDNVYLDSVSTVTLGANAIGKIITITKGILDANNFNITAQQFIADSAADNITIYMRAGTWTINTQWLVFEEGGGGVITLDAGTSKLVLITGTSVGLSNITFANDCNQSVTFYDVEVQGQGFDPDDVYFNSSLTFTTAFPWYFNTLKFIPSGSTMRVRFQENFTYHVNGLLQANGSVATPIEFLTLYDPNKATIFAGSVSVSYINVINNIAAGAIPFENYPGGVDSGNNTNWCFTENCHYIEAMGTSLVSVVNRVQQNLSYPQFVIGGKGAFVDNEYALFKKSSTMTNNRWRSKVYQIGQDFDIEKITFNIIPDLTVNTKITPYLYFDDESNIVTGTVINDINYSNDNKLIALTAKNFENEVHGKDNFFLEFQFTGSDLAVVGLPIFIDVEIVENV